MAIVARADSAAESMPNLSGVSSNEAPESFLPSYSITHCDILYPKPQ